VTKCTIIQKHLSLLIICFSTIQFCPAHSAAGVRAHNCGLYQASTHIAAEPTLTTINHDIDLQTQINLALQTPPLLTLSRITKKLPSKPRALLYLYIPMVHSIYTFPWSMDHRQANSLSIILHYFRADNPLT